MLAPLWRRETEILLKCENHVSEALRLSAELLALSDREISTCDHDGCLLLDGVIRDCAWRIRQAALQWRLDLSIDEGSEEAG